MKSVLILTVVFIPLMIAYLAFLAQRDQKMFDAYNQATSQERDCQQQANWHPGCKIE